MKKNFHVTGVLAVLFLAVAALFAGGTAYADMPAADPQDPEYVERLEKGLLGEISDADSNQLGAGASTSALADGTNPYTGNTYVHDSRFDGCEILDGIDVSKWNGSSINWTKVKADGIDFVLLRIGYTNLKSEFTMNKDEQFDNYLAGVKEAGLPIGIYYYSQATTSSEARKEADYVLSLLDGMSLDYPVVFDSESPTNSRVEDADLSKSEYTALAKVFCSRISAAGYKTMVYGSYNGLQNDYNASALESFTNIWLARYVTTKSGYAAQYSGDYCMWQYTSTGHVSGISTYTDCNFYYSGTISSNTSSAVSVQGQAGSNSASLSWNTVDGATSYQILRSDSANGTFTQIAEVTGSSYTDTGLQSGCAYYYRVVPVTASGAGDASSTVTVKIAWTSPVYIKTSRSVYTRSGAGTRYAKKKKVSAGTICRSDYTSKDAKGRTWYHITGSKSGFICASYCRYAAPSLSVTTGVKASSRGKTSITLTWKKQTAATGYQIYRADALNGKYRRVGTVTGTNSFTVTGLKRACTYYFKVRAYYRFGGKSSTGKLSSPRLIATKSAAVRIRTRKSVTLRKYAGTVYRSLGTVSGGKTLTALYRSRDRSGKWWYYVKVKIGGRYRKGYIPKSMVKKVSSGG